VQDLAVEVGKSTKDISGGLYEVISTFGDTADTMEILRINAVAAKAGLAQTEEALGLTAAVTKGYNTVTVEAVQHAADLGFMAVNLGQTTFPELAASIGTVVPIAAALGVTQEELFASMATLTGVTGNTAEVTTQLRATYQAILKPTEQMQKAISDVAGQLDAQGRLVGGELVDNWRGLVDQYNAGATKIGLLVEQQAAMEAAGQKGSKAYKELSVDLKKLENDSEKTAKSMNEAAGALGGTIVETVGISEAIELLNLQFEGNTLKSGQAWSSVEALTAVMALSGSQAESYKEKLAAMGDVTGTTEEAFYEQTQTINQNGFEMEQLQAKAEVLLQKLGDGLAPAIGKVIDVLMPLIDLVIGAADGFSKMDEGQQLVIVGVLAVIASIGPLLVVVGTLITTVAGVVAAWGTIVTLAPIVGAAFTVLLGPVGLIILAIAGITAAVLILWTTNEDFRNAVTGIWDGISAAFLGALDLIKLAFEDFPEFQRRAWEAVISLTKAYVNTYIKIINFFIDQLNKLQIDVPKVELPGGGSVGGFTIDLPNIPSIPELARGALALRPTLAMFGEAGPEAAVPLERLNGMIAQASSAGANQALAQAGGPSGPAWKVEMHNPQFYGSGGPREFVRQINRIGTENTRTRVAVQGD
jgi:hypothetical protein